MLGKIFRNIALLLLFFSSSCGVLIRGVSSGFSEMGSLFEFGRRGELTEEEYNWGIIAWRYFENNHNYGTGLANSIHNFPVADMWDSGDYLAALYSAHQLGIIDNKKFDSRLSSFLSFLGRMSLAKGILPNKLYNTKTGVKVNYSNKSGEIGWSALDIGRILIWLKIIREEYPVFREYIDKAVMRWNFCDVINDEGELFRGSVENGKLRLTREGELGFEEYSARGFQAWGFETSKASRAEPYETIETYGVKIPFDARDLRRDSMVNITESLPYLIDGMEFGWDSLGSCIRMDFVTTHTNMSEFANRIYLGQEKRYEKEKILTAKSKVRIKQAPYKIFDAIYANGYLWNTISQNGKLYPRFSQVSVKAVFGMWALWKTDYTELLINSIKHLYDKKNGWYEGRYERDGGYNTIFTCATNSMVLEALLFKSRGIIYTPANDDSYYEAILRNEFQATKKCFPIPGER